MRYITGPLGKHTRPPAIEFQNVTVRHHDITILDAIDLTVPVGAAVAIIVRDQPTVDALLACLQGYTQPTAGRIHLLEQPVPPMTPAISHQIGIMPTSLQTRPGTTVAQILARFASYHHSQFTNTQLASYCKLYQLPPDALVTDLPPLQTRILALALALVHDPQLVLLEHPLADLTPTAQTAFHRFVVRLRSEGRTLLATFNDPLADNMRSVYDMVVTITNGRLSQREEG